MDTTRQSVLFPRLFEGKPVVAKFDQEHSSSDGGALLLKAVDERLGLSRRLAGCIEDRRQPGKIQHELEELLRQRMFGIACGYADANDAARIGDDPIHKLLAGRDPVAGEALASQPTLSRFENRVRPPNGLLGGPVYVRILTGGYGKGSLIFLHPSARH